MSDFDLRLGLVLALLVVVGFLGGYVIAQRLYEDPLNEEGRPLSDNSSRGQNEEQKGAEQAVEPQLTSGAELIYRVRYVPCALERVEKREVTAQMAGLNEEELTKLLAEEETTANFTVASFASDRVVLEWRREGKCTEMEKWRTVGIHQGHVSVFKGKGTRWNPIETRTEIPGERLLPSDARALQEGKVLGREEAYLYLEGLTE